MDHFKRFKARSLSHFLFLLIGGVLSSITEKRMSGGVIEGSLVGNNKVHVFHLKFVDDILFLLQGGQSI